MILVFKWLLSGGQGFLLALSAAEHARMSWVHHEACVWISPELRAVLGALNVAELALFGKGFCTASLRRAGQLEHPQLFYIF